MSETAASRDIQPNDVRLAAALCADQLAPLVEADWSRPAGDMDWDCRSTLEHVVGALDRYTLHLAIPSPVPAPRVQASYPNLSHADMLTTMRMRAAILAAVADVADPAARGHHPWGRPDPAGYIAMGCIEILVHTGDISRSLGATFQPPEALCRRVAARLFPWAPTDVDGWSALCWLTGRLDLPGHGRVAADWAWHAAPVSEWDGEVKTHASYGFFRAPAASQVPTSPERGSQR